MSFGNCKAWEDSRVVDASCSLEVPSARPSYRIINSWYSNNARLRRLPSIKATPAVSDYNYYLGSEGMPSFVSLFRERNKSFPGVLAISLPLKLVPLFPFVVVCIFAVFVKWSITL